MTSATYDHTQKGSPVAIVFWFVIFAVIVTPIVMTAGSFPPYFVLVFLAPIAIVALSIVIFSRMRIVVGDGMIRWGFGYGFPSFSLPLSEVSTATAVTNPWFYGLGIHFIPRGTIYNVWGTAGVEITRVNGRRIRLGTDEPDALASAILRARL